MLLNYTTMKEGRLYLASAIAVLVLFQLTYGFTIVLPTNVNWLMSARHDWGTHYLGWFFYRSEPWQFPLGHVTKYFYPLGTNVGFTDTIPLLAIFFKLFAPLLPADFQYFGLWLLACNLLLAWYTVRFLLLFNVRHFYIFLGVVLIVANPVLVFRVMHPALCAHWLILGSIFCYFKDPRGNAVRGILREQFLLLLLSALINPYLCFMVLGFALILPLKLHFYDKVLKSKPTWGYIGILVFSLLAAWVVTGMITLGKKEDLNVSGAYGLYSLNLNALYNPFSWSAIFPTPKLVSWHQYEGYMYLGAGVGLLLLVLGVYRILQLAGVSKGAFSRDRSAAYYRPDKTLLWVVVILYALFALTNVISINDKVLFKIPLPDFLLNLGEVFRASARFFWVVFYLLLFYLLIAVSKMKIPAIAVSVILVVAVLVQLYDTKSLLLSRHLVGGPYTPPLDDRWKKLMAATNEVIMYPPFEATYIKQLDYQDFCYLAARLHKPITTGYVARVDNGRTRLFTDSLVDALQEARISRALYVTTADHLSLFTNVLLEKKLRMSILDGYLYMYASDSVGDKGIDAMSDALNAQSAFVLDSLRRSVQPAEYVEYAANGAREQLQEGKLKFYFERMIKGSKYLSCSGWGIIENKTSNKGDSIFSLLLSDRKSYIGQTKCEKRPDIASVYKADLEDAGFKSVISTNQVDSGSYKIGIGIEDGSGKIVYATTDSLLRVDGTHHVRR